MPTTLEEDTFIETAKNKAFNATCSIIVNAINNLNIDVFTDNSKNAARTEFITLAQKIFDKELGLVLQKTLEKKHNKEQKILTTKQETEKQKFAQLIQHC